MRFIFLDEYKRDDKYFKINGDDYRHLIANRYQPKDMIKAKYGDYIGNFVICKISSTYLSGEFFPEKKIENPEHYISLILGLPKDRALFPTLEKSAEIGIKDIFITPTVNSDRKDINETKFERMKKIVKESCMQSGNYFIPCINYFNSLSIILEKIKDDYTLKLLLDEGYIENINPFDIYSKYCIENFSRVVIFVGPEGGINENEKNNLIKSGFISISLGSNILRTETAAIGTIFFLKQLQNFIYKRSFF
ncbi:MAG: RNA methyltransferase [Spirochaetes bacterium]|nr:RNA methyltransferase [Spirochaetota bacterium]MBP8991018.1 RNA methyltransferase [Spirochaetota bacterium]HOV45417.1 RsmE family RNA methyltransferase [Exilispira sp.]